MPNPIAGLMPVLRKAADTIEQFTGTPEEASRSSVITDAVEIINVIAPLVDSYSHGMNISPEDVRDALAGMDEALSDFDAEIAKQGG